MVTFALFNAVKLNVQSKLFAKKISPQLDTEIGVHLSISCV